MKKIIMHGQKNIKQECRSVIIEYLLVYYKISYTRIFLLKQNGELVTETFYVHHPIKYQHILIIFSYWYL